MLSNAEVSESPWWYAGEQHIHTTLIGSQSGEVRVEGGREVNHIISSKREKRLDNRSWKPQDSCSGIFLSWVLDRSGSFWRKWDTFSSAYLFQDGFSLRRLVSKTAQEELGQLDCEVGEEGEVSYNVRRDALWNKKAQIKEAEKYQSLNPSVHCF